MPSLLIRLLLCLSSYFPLAAIFAVQLYFQGFRTAGIAALVVGTVGLIGMAAYLRVAKRLNTSTVEILSVSRKDGEAMSYIVSYLLPFIALPSGDVASIASLSIFLFVLVVLYINSDMLHINPMLNLAGWHVYEVKLKDGEARVLLSKKRIRKGSQADVIRISEEILAEIT